MHPARALDLLLCCLVALVRVCPCCGYTGAWDPVVVGQLKQTLLAEDVYDTAVRPEAVTRVYVGMALQELQAFDTGTQVVTLFLWWRLFWMDPRLSWEAANYNNITKIQLLTEQVWTPDMIMWEASEVVTNVGPEQGPPSGLTTRSVQVTSDGAVLQVYPNVVKFLCPMDLEHFPFDRQECTMNIGPWTYTGCEQNTLPMPANRTMTDVAQWALLDDDETDWEVIDLNELSQTNEVFIIKAESTMQAAKFQCCPEPFTYLTVKLTFKRASLPYIYSAIIPLVLISTVGIFSVFTHPAGGERLSLSITVVLATVAVMWTTWGIVPKMGQWTVISSLAVSCICINVAVTLETIVIIYLVSTAEEIQTGREQWAPYLPVWVLSQCFLKAPVAELAENQQKRWRKEQELENGDTPTPEHSRHSPTGVLSRIRRGGGGGGGGGGGSSGGGGGRGPTAAISSARTPLHGAIVGDDDGKADEEGGRGPSPTASRGSGGGGSEGGVAATDGGDRQHDASGEEELKREPYRRAGISAALSGGGGEDVKPPSERAVSSWWSGAQAVRAESPEGDLDDGTQVESGDPRMLFRKPSMRSSRRASIRRPSLRSLKGVSGHHPSSSSRRGGVGGGDSSVADQEEEWEHPQADEEALEQLRHGLLRTASLMDTWFFVFVAVLFAVLVAVELAGTETINEPPDQVENVVANNRNWEQVVDACSML